jgi:hypothetical protein
MRALTANAANPRVMFRSKVALGCFSTAASDLSVKR